LIKDRELIVTDSEPPRVFKVTLQSYMRKLVFPPSSSRLCEEDFPDLGPGILMKELLGKGYRGGSKRLRAVTASAD
jgi:hypothetical protein